MPQAERPDWPNFGDGPAHLPGNEHGSAFMREDERWKAEAEGRPPVRFSLVFAQRDKNGDYPVGSFEPRSGLKPEDLKSLKLTPEQIERLIPAFNQLSEAGSLGEMYALRFSPWFAELDGEMKEWGVQVMVESGEIAARDFPVWEKRQKKQRELEEQWRAEADSRPDPLEGVFAQPDQNGHLPRGAFQLRLDMAPQELEDVGLDHEQAVRLIEAIKVVCGPSGDTGLRGLSPGFANIPDERRENLVQLFEGIAYLNNVNYINERDAIRQKEYREERRKTGLGVDVQLN